MARDSTAVLRSEWLATLMGVLRFQRFVDFVTQLIENFAGRAGDLDFFQMARPGQVHDEFFFHPSGTETHENNTLAQSNGFPPIVGDQQDRATGLGPDLS